MSSTMNVAFIQKAKTDGKYTLALQKHTNNWGETYYRLPMVLNTTADECTEHRKPLCSVEFKDQHVGKVTIMAFDESDALPAPMKDVENVEFVEGGVAVEMMETYLSRCEDGIQLSLTSGEMLRDILPAIQRATATGKRAWFTTGANFYSGKLGEHMKQTFA